jgi:MFS family permease
VNSYLLAMAALFTFGGRLADIAGHRRMVTIGIVVFGGASVLCGLTPPGPVAEGWLVAWRAVQGAGAALMYPAALAIVVNAYAVEHRGRALALFFGVAGGLTAVGPAVGGVLTAWTWRSIFWINVPIAAVALALVFRAEPADARRPGRLDTRGLLLVTSGAGLGVFGLEQSASWGWTDPRSAGSLLLAVALLVAFVLVERRTEAPLINVSIFRNRSFRVEGIVLFAAMTVFLRSSSSPASTGRSRSARHRPGPVSCCCTSSPASSWPPSSAAGCSTGAARDGRSCSAPGWRPPACTCGPATSPSSRPAPRLRSSSSPAPAWGCCSARPTPTRSTPRRHAYGEATGITQTVRNLGASVGLAAGGAILAGQLRDHVTASLAARGVPAGRAHELAAGIAQLRGGRAGSAIPAFLRSDFASATAGVLTAMSWVMVATAVVAFVGLPRSGRHNRRAAVVQAAGQLAAPVGGR